MKQYPALTIISWIYRLFAVLVVAVSILAGIADQTAGGLVAATLVGLLMGLTVYAVGELIALVIQIAADTKVSSEVLIRLYADRQRKEQPKTLTRPELGRSPNHLTPVRTNKGK